MKKLIAILLAAVVIVGCIPFSVSAQQNLTRSTQKRYSVLVLDVSDTAEFLKSGRTIYTANSAISYVKQSAKQFLTDLLNARGENYVAVVSFAEQAQLVSGFTNDISSVSQKVSSLTAHDTVRDINAGLTKANALLQDADTDAVKNVILVTTGMTNAGTYSYSGAFDESTVGSNWYRTDTNIRLYAYANSACATAEAVKANATLYVLGLFQTMESMPEAGKNIAEFFRLTAATLATSEDTFYDVDDPSQIDFAFGEIVDDITDQHGKFKYAGFIVKDVDSESDYYYSDSYFKKDASHYNASLATMSLCLELSSWSSYNKTSWYSKNASVNDSAFWNDKLINIKTLLLGSPDENAGDDYKGIGFTDFRANDFWQSAPKKDSIGLCAARKQITDNNGNPYTLVALVVRGGGYGAEWASNFTIGESGEHDGFSTARDNAVTFLKNYLSDLPDDISRNVKLWITGYSRAGATANMVAGKLDDNPSLPKGFVTQKSDIFCYTFEAPQGAVKNEINSDNYSNIHNALNYNDLVPLVAPNNWGFARYNYQEDHLFPSPYTVSNSTFTTQLNAMKQQLTGANTLGFTDFEYKISEVSTMKNFKVNRSIFTAGLPVFYLEDSSVSTHDVMETGIRLVSQDLIPGRSYYYENLQYCVRELLGVLMDYYGAQQGATNYAFDVIFRQIFCNTQNLFTVENIAYILEPAVNLNPFYSQDARKREIYRRVGEKLGGIFQDATQISGFLDAMGEILGDFFVKIAAEMLLNNTDTLNNTAKLIETIVSSEFQGHYPEICLAWCRSEDPNYNSEIAESKSAITRLIRINCPVDVSIYDSTGALVGAFKDDQPDESIDGVINYRNNKDEKLVYLPGDEDYTLEIKATGDGNFNYSLSEFNFVLYDNTRLRNYYNIPIKTGDTLKSIVPAIPENEQEANDENGSTVSYQLYYNNKMCTADEDFTGAEIDSVSYTVTLNTEGNGGTVDGAGTFLKGSFAKVTAEVLPTGTFLGWYIGDEKVSDETEYRFAVTADITLTARFTDINFCQLEVLTEGNGNVDFNNENNYFPEGSKIQLQAIPKDGSAFKEWKLEGSGTVSDKNVADMIYTIGSDSKAKLTAVFTEAEKPQETTAEMITKPPVTNPSPQTPETVSQPSTTVSQSYITPSAVDSTPIATGDMLPTILIIIVCIGLCGGIVYRFRKAQKHSS